MASVESKDIPRVAEFMRQFWPFMKDTWLAEDTDDYWTPMLDRANELAEEYADEPVTLKLILGYLEYQNELWYERNNRRA